MELKTEIDSTGKLQIVHQKRFAFGALRDLAHDLLDRSEDADKEKGEDEYSDLVAVVLLLVASLEAFVNDMLIAQARHDYGKDYKQVAEGLLGGSMRSRILRLVPVRSKGRKRLDTGHHAVGLLFGLIKSRNRLAHTVEYYVERPSWDRDSAAPLGQTLTHEECAAYAAAVDTYFGAVLSGPPVLKGRKPWNHQLVVDAEPEREEQKKGEQNAGQVSSEAAQSAPPDEPSA